jgi:hypothetical protein
LCQFRSAGEVHWAISNQERKGNMLRIPVLSRDQMNAEQQKVYDATVHAVPRELLATGLRVILWPAWCKVRR